DSKFFMESETCGESGCHPDIFAMWSGSMHKFSSFNNQWYRRSITYMQEMQGQIESSKWCAGCHDPAVLLTGRWTKPMSEQLDMPEAHAGLGCAACHSIAHVKNTMGNSGVVYEYPPMHRFVDTGNPLYKAVHDFITKLDPAPHRETFLKPFHTEQSSEFCSSCHKVHLDEPVNNFRWVRGFNEYDAWQGSGVSGMGSLSFYYPPSPKGCVDCHMPLVESRDKGNKKGMVHSHRFPAANTAVPYANLDREQFNVTEAFLKANIVTLDIFGMTIGEADDQAESYSRGGEPTTFSMSGDESGLVAGLTGGSSTDAANLIAPLDEVGATIRRGDSARLSVVVRTRGVGHRFPGGTFDAFDVWVELEMRDKATNALVYHSGGIEPDGRVDRGAHFYRAIMLDANGNVIDKRNAFAARTLLYARGIPPGAADTVHFRLNIPKDAGDELVVNARLHYRKFMDFNTKFAFAGVPADDAPHDENYDDRAWQFTGDTTGNAGKINGIPDLPTITIAEDSLVLKVLPSDAAPIEPRVVETKALRERWNDYGIGLLLQGDLKGARAIFERVTRIEAEYADGWVNVARVALREGDLDNAETNLREAIRLLDKTPPENPHRAKAHYFLAQVHKARGDLDDAMAELTIAVKQYPNDRNIRNSIGRTLYLKRDFKGAIASYEKTLAIDPEDLTAHYNMMQAYRGLGNNDKAREHQTYFMRFKADESVQAISGHTRRKYPDLNLERQAIRDQYQMEMPSFSPKEYGGTIEVVTAMSKK
ncbi:MAG: tetratricopeptide repeat protein, partial [Candidatus Poribacteria bacterium]|nr:tetratricopeptide repeat protein [Candidatus Poribacteria bacterium]